MERNRSFCGRYYKGMSPSIVGIIPTSRFSCPSLLKHCHFLSTQRQTAHTSGNNTNQNISNVQLLFKEDTPKAQSVKRAKKILAKVSDGKYDGITDPKLEHFITVLSRDRVPNNATLRNRSRQLYSLIIRNKITDDEVYEAIRETSKGSNNIIVNVKLPKSTEQHSLPLKKNSKQKSFNGIRGLHPQEENQFNKILEKIENNSIHHTNDLYQILSNLIEESNEMQIFQGSHGGGHTGVGSKGKAINLQYLEDYLTQLEKNERQKNLYLKEQQRVYDWSQTSASDTAIPSGVQLLFNSRDKRGSRRPFQMGDIFSFRSNLSSGWIGPNSSVSPSKYLFLNLKDGTKDIKVVKDTNYSGYSIDYRDLLGIVNSVGSMHEDVFSQIQKVGEDGWVPIGNLHDEPKIVVFKRNSEDAGTTAVTSAKLAILLSLLLGISLGVYYLKPQTNEGHHNEQKVQ